MYIIVDFFCSIPGVIVDSSGMKAQYFSTFDEAEKYINEHFEHERCKIVKVPSAFVNN